MNSYSNPSPSRNPSKADAMPGKVATPQGKAPTPSDQATGTGHKPGRAIAGFSGGVMPGKC